MKGKINKIGWLEILRFGLMEVQLCPFTRETSDEEPRRCGDQCPHFSEPVDWADGKRIEICHGKKLYFTELVDERKSNEDDAA